MDLILNIQLNLDYELINESSITLSDTLNNEIVTANFQYSEDRKGNMFLHKKSQDYYVIVNFFKCQPPVNKKAIIDEDNEIIEEQVLDLSSKVEMLKGMGAHKYEKEQNQKSI